MTKGIVGLDLRWKYDVKLFPAKKLASDWLTLLVNQSEVLGAMCTEAVGRNTTASAAVS